MCQINNVLAAAARRAADANFELNQVLCDATPREIDAALRHLTRRGDTKARAILQVMARGPMVAKDVSVSFLPQMAKQLEAVNGET